MIVTHLPPTEFKKILTNVFNNSFKYKPQAQQAVDEMMVLMQPHIVDVGEDAPYLQNNLLHTVSEAIQAYQRNNTAEDDGLTVRIMADDLYNQLRLKSDVEPYL